MGIQGPTRARAIGMLVLGLVLLSTIGNTNARSQGSTSLGEGRWKLAKAHTGAPNPGSCLACHKLASSHSTSRIGAILVGITNRLPRDTDELSPRMAGVFVPAPFEVNAQPLLAPEAIGQALGDRILLRY